MFVLTLSHFVYVAMRGGTMFYYFQLLRRSSQAARVLAERGSAAGDRRACRTAGIR